MELYVQNARRLALIAALAGGAVVTLLAINLCASGVVWGGRECWSGVRALLSWFGL